MPNPNTVAYDTLPDGKIVSTVCLPFPHPGGSYETMVFPGTGQWSELDMARYETRADAETGHAAMVAKWQDGTPAETTTLDMSDPDELSSVITTVTLSSFGKPVFRASLRQER